MSPITLLVRSGGDFDIHQGERFAFWMAWDEMIGQLATLTRGNAPIFPMMHADDIVPGSKPGRGRSAILRTITIYPTANTGWFTVYEGDASSGQLTWQEMLGQIITLTIGVLSPQQLSHGLYGMSDTDHVVAYMARMAARRAEREAEARAACPF